jgi:hypothetical protein
VWRNKTAAVITLTDPEAVFDGSAKAVIAGTNPTGLDGLSIAYSQGGSPVASQTNAGVYPVLATLDNEEYEAEPVAGTLTIHPANTQPSLESARGDFGGDGPRLGSAECPEIRSFPTTGMLAFCVQVLETGS